MELCSGGTLEDWIQNNAQIKQDDALKMLYQIGTAVAYIHANGLTHRDLKPGNIFCQKGTIKIGDFGLATRKGGMPSEKQSTVVPHSSRPKAEITRGAGTELYMAPEQHAELLYNYKVDIYSLGLIFLELLVAFGNQRKQAMLEAVKMKGFNYQTTFKDSFLPFLARTLEDWSQSKDEEWKKEAEEVLEHLKQIPRYVHISAD